MTSLYPYKAKHCLNLNLKIQHVYAHVCRVRYGDRSRSEMYRHWKHRPFPIILSVHLFVIEVLLLNMKMLCSYPLAVKLWTYTQLKTKMYVYLHAMPFLSNVTSLWVNSGFMPSTNMPWVFSKMIASLGLKLQGLFEFSNEFHFKRPCTYRNELHAHIHIFVIVLRKFSLAE